MSDKIPVGISSCLLGQPVRFDGGHKRLIFAVQDLAPWVHFEAICPEQAIGLSTPRPALRLVDLPGEGPALRYSNGAQGDLTADMTAFAKRKVASLNHLCGYIVCAKSPSCGMERVRVYDLNGNNNRKAGRGLFCEVLMREMPWLPVEEDGRLHDSDIRENFVTRIFALYELNLLEKRGLSRATLIAFHSRYKLVLLAHSQPLYRELGRFVASLDNCQSLSVFFIEYRQRLMDLLSHKATRRNHTNVLMHIQGYFRGDLNGRQRQELATLIDAYRRGIQPLLAPVTLLKHYLAEYPNDYLQQQRYFDPYPESLALRYGS